MLDTASVIVPPVRVCSRAFSHPAVVLAHRVRADQTRSLTWLQMIVSKTKPINAKVGAAINLGMAARSVEICWAELLLQLILTLVRRISDDRFEFRPRVEHRVTTNNF